MYIMEIKIGSYSMRGELIILGVFLMAVIWAHAISSCVNIPKFGIAEGFEMAKQVVEKVKGVQDNNVAYTSQFSEYQSVWGLASYPKSQISPANNLAVNNDMNDVNTPFNNPPLSITNSANFKPYQLPEGELDMLANSSFKPECCPNVYSNSKGCVCATDDQVTFLKQRGGNNYPETY